MTAAATPSLDHEKQRVRASLAAEIARRIAQSGMTQREASQLLGAHQPDISRIVNGRIDGYSAERLSVWLRLLRA